MRYQKVVNKNGVETARYNYVYADGQLILLSYTANGATQNAKFIYGSTGEVLGFIVDGTTQYLYVKNLQGDIVAIVNESGVPVVRYIYDAWGNVTITTDSGYENLINLSPFAYRGYCYDNDIKMYYLQSRYYDPQICRFINADSSEYLGATGTVLSCNLFAYCENDPVDNVDPSGKYSAKKALKYAKQWWNKCNPNYKENVQDCANFVSQCLFAGNLCKMTGVGKYGWHHYIVTYGLCLNKYGQPCYYPTTWQISNAWGIASDLFNYLVKTRKCKKHLIKSTKALYKAIDENWFSSGDVAFFLEDGEIHHAVLIGKIIKDKNNKNVYFYAHSSNRNGYDTTSANSYSFKDVLKNEMIYIVDVK